MSEVNLEDVRRPNLKPEPPKPAARKFVSEEHFEVPDTDLTIVEETYSDDVITYRVELPHQCDEFIIAWDGNHRDVLDDIDIMVAHLGEARKYISARRGS